MPIEGLIKTQWLRNEGPLPLLVQASADGIDPAYWASNNREWVETQLLQHGGLLIRNFSVNSVVEFERFITTISGELLDYTNRSTPRSQVSGKIYSSTEYPADQSIALHNELAYSREWPMKIWFLCMRSAKGRGETPIADSRAVFNRIDPKTRQRFISKKVMYVRTYGHGLDLPWQNAFQTESKSDVEVYCRGADIEVEWMDNDHLRTRQVCQAVATHPKTGEMVWFNQAHLFHVSNLKPEIRESLLSLFKEEDLPRNAYYGDGAPIEPAVLDEIREIYQQEAVIFPWREGDILMLDNMLTAHGRAPFVGPRNVVVGMAEPFAGQDN
jgi:alpha-ketoglutarate-dependent taurine dioxygenase